MKEDYVTFESLGIKYPPYIDEYREKFGEYPTMQLYRETELPVKFRQTRNGVFIPLVNQVFAPSHQFRVQGSVPPVKSPERGVISDDGYIVLGNPTDLGEQIIIPCYQMIARMHIIKPKTSKRKAWVKL